MSSQHSGVAAHDWLREAVLRPPHAADPDAARQSYWRHGACLFTGNPSADAPRRLREVFGAELFGVWPEFTARPHRVPGRSLRPMRARRIMWEPTEPDTVRLGDDEVTATPAQGVTSEGAHLIGGGPDVLALDLIEPAAAGGGYRLLDGYAVWAELDPADRRLLTEVPLRLKLRTTVPPTIRPLIQQADDGRVVLTHRPTAIERADDDSPAYRAALAAADRWHAAAAHAAAAATPLILVPGQLLLIDCHRVLYARDRYLGNRRVERWWAWTTTAFGFPMTTRGSRDESELDEPDPD